MIGKVISPMALELEDDDIIGLPESMEDEEELDEDEQYVRDTTNYWEGDDYIAGEDGEDQDYEDENK